MYTIDELTAETGFTKWQIYRFRKKRVLSPALRAPNPHNPAIWGDIHLRELRQVRRIMENNRTLADIRDYLHGEDT